MPIFRQQSPDDLEFLVTEVVEYLRELFETKKFGKIDGEDGQTGGTFLVGYHGKLYTIERDFQVNCFRDGMIAIGAGAEYALGSLYTTSPKSNMKTRVLKALEAASYFSPYVAGPYALLGSKKSGEVFLP